MKFLLTLCLCIQVFSTFGFRDNDLTVVIPPGNFECFYQNVKAGLVLEVEYQVIDGGDLDIDFMMKSPNGKVVVNEMRKPDAIHTVDETDEGDYEVCFSNRFSRISQKVVFFEIIIDSDGGDYMDDFGDDDEDWKNFIAPDETYGDKLATLEVASEAMNVIKTNNAKTVQLQSLLRVFEAKDRNIVERNFYRINLWSVINMVVMASVFILQVIMVKGMFSDKKVSTKTVT